MTINNFTQTRDQLAKTRLDRAKAIAQAGGLAQARAAGVLPQRIDLSVSEALVMGIASSTLWDGTCSEGPISSAEGEQQNAARLGVVQYTSAEAEALGA